MLAGNASLYATGPILSSTSNTPWYLGDILAQIPIFCYIFIIQDSIILGFLTERITSTSIKHKTMTTMFFLGETINGENPTTSSEIESAPKVKPQNSKMISRQH